MGMIKCEECGEMLEAGVKECPKCGCPVPEIKQDIKKNTAEYVEPKVKKSIMPYIALILGIIILGLGIFVVKKEVVDVESHTANSYNVDTAIFGADFYTEIYDASDTIVDELNDINNGVAILSESVIEIINAIYFSAGMIICAIGISVIGVSCIHIGKRE